MTEMWEEYMKEREKTPSIIYTSYFYQIRNFPKNYVPISVCVSDPAWYHDFKGRGHCYFDKRGVYCGVYWDKLIVQKDIECACPCEKRTPPRCKFLHDYYFALQGLDFGSIRVGLNFFLDKTMKNLGVENAIPVFIFHEAPKNKCSEREMFHQIFRENGFNIKELDYPIVT